MPHHLHSSGNSTLGCQQLQAAYSSRFGECFRISLAGLRVLLLLRNALKLIIFYSHRPCQIELELELIQTQMAQKPMLRAEVGMRVRCANKASAE